MRRPCWRRLGDGWPTAAAPCVPGWSATQIAAGGHVSTALSSPQNFLKNIWKPVAAAQLFADPLTPARWERRESRWQSLDLKRALLYWAQRQRTDASWTHRKDYHRPANWHLHSVPFWREEITLHASRSRLSVFVMKQSIVCRPFSPHSRAPLTDGFII